MPVELRHLRYFVAVAEELHFGRAAERLHISQPPLSQAIRSLEDDLGCELFRRTSRQVELTTAGEALLEPARATLSMADAAVAVAQEAANDLRGRLRIGVTPVARYSVAPAILSAFRARHPNVEMQKREELSGPLIAAVQAGELDAALVYCAERLDGVDYQPVKHQELVAIVPEPHPLAARGSAALADLANECFLMPRETLAPGFRAAIERLCLEAGFSPQFAAETIEFDEDLLAVRGGRGITLTTRDFAGERTPGVCVLRLDPPPALPIELATPTSERSRLVGHFADVVRELRSDKGWLEPRPAVA
jgi:DNA-binding transcriptional LysR family regulator